MTKRKGERTDILNFEQGAEFMLRMGRKHIERGDMVRGLYYIRKAYQKQPEDADTVMALGEILNRMQRFEESSRVLLLYAQTHDLPSDGLFGLASNFMAQEEFGVAEYCLTRYLKEDPEGIYADDADDYLSIITDRDELSYQLGLENDDDLELLGQLHYVKFLHLSRRDEDARAYTRALKQRYPNSVAVDLELAMLDFCLKDYEKSEQGLFNLLKTEKDNVRARCLLALLYRTQGRAEQATDMLRSVKLSVNASTEELSNAALVFLEFGEYERGLTALERLRRMVPYDEQVLHQIGYCRMARQEKAEAEKIYLLLLRLDEDDTVAQYYMTRVREGEPEDFQNEWTIVYAVPYLETFRRLTYIKDIVEGGPEALQAAWKDDLSFRQLLRWVLFDTTTGSKAPIIATLQELGDDRARLMLNEFLLLQNQPDAEKQAVVAALREMQAEMPHIMFYNGSWQQGRFRPLVIPQHIPVGYEMILKLIRSVADKHSYPQQTTELAYKTCIYFISALEGSYPRLSPEQEHAYAAAFMLLAVQTTNADVSMEDILDSFSVTERRLMNALKRIFALLEGE